jgi:hypothetical protein
MKHVIYVLGIAAISCSPQKNVPNTQADSAVVVKGQVETSGAGIDTNSMPPVKPALPGTPAVSVPTKTGEVKHANDVPAAALPKCINKLIVQFKAEEVQNPPRKIFSYTYNGNPVYYVPAPCCDFFSDLYDKNCELIAHPDGGFTGKGDGRAKDFNKTKTNERLVWADPRK